MESVLMYKPMKCYTIDFYELHKTIQGSIRKNIKKSIESGFAIAVIVTTDLETGLAGLDSAGNQILEILYKFGFWIITIKCIYDIIQHALKGDRRAVGNTVITYVIIYGSLFFVPWALRLVKNIF